MKILCEFSGAKVPRLPDGVVLLHHAESLGQLDSAERAAEVAEEVAVARAEDEEVVVARALGTRREAETSAAGELTAETPWKETGAGSSGSPSIQIARSLFAGGSLIPSTRFQASARPSAARPTPADQCQLVCRFW